MKLLQLTCNHCGAPLEVPGKTQYLTCTYCSSRLRVVQNGNAAYTDVLEAIGKTTDDIRNDVQAIRIQNEIERLDREWLIERENFTVRRKNGSEHVPTEGSAILAMTMPSIVGIGWTVIALHIGAGFILALVGIVVTLFAVAYGITILNTARGYTHAHNHYEDRRRRLIRQLTDMAD